MKTFQFTIKEHQEHGTIGLAPKWYPTGEPLMGMGAAHDILEHFPNDDGSTEGELMALGAAIFIRADGGYSTKYRHFDERKDIPSDFPNIIMFHMDRENGRPLRKAPRVQDSELRDRTKEIAEEAKRLVRGEDLQEDFTKEDWKQVARWMAHGYQKARKRYNYAHACRLATLFMDIERACDDALKLSEVEGETVIVRVDYRELSAKVTLQEIEFSDY